MKTKTESWNERDRRLEAEAKAEGRTHFTGRCNCYNGHGSASGRCHAGQELPLWTLPERGGICDHCWTACGHADRKGGAS